jgi:23S rRNA (guanosine2251-2'-O)-methyltransferase
MPRRARAGRGSAPSSGANAEVVAYGIHPVRVLLQRAPQRVRCVWLSSSREAASRLQELRALASHAGIVTNDATTSAAGLAGRGGAAPGRTSWSSRRSADDPETQLEQALESLDGAAPLLLVLDGVTDPHNLGACLRSADAAGVAAVLVPRDRAAGITPVVRKVAAGAAETVPLVQVVNLARTLRELRERGVWLVGTSDDAPRTLYDLDLTGPTAFVLGSEGEGMRRLTRESCDELVSIPMAGAVESLNVSVATGVALFEAVRQRRAASQPGRSGGPGRQVEVGRLAGVFLFRVRAQQQLDACPQAAFVQPDLQAARLQPQQLQRGIVLAALVPGGDERVPQPVDHVAVVDRDQGAVEGREQVMSSSPRNARRRDRQRQAATSHWTQKQPRPSVPTCAVADAVQSQHTSAAGPSWRSRSDANSCLMRGPI